MLLSTTLGLSKLGSWEIFLLMPFILFFLFLSPGDALGSVVVIISALVIWFTDWEYEMYIDPAMSILLVCIISYTTLPLLRESALILMQTVPTHIEIEDIKKRLLEIDGVHAVHELHIWQLAGDRIIASAHIRCHDLQEYMRVAGKIKQFFHDVGIHSTTMQPEFEEVPANGVGGAPDDEAAIQAINALTTCIISCPQDAKNCEESVCCRPTANGKVPLGNFLQCLNWSSKRNRKRKIDNLVQ